AFRQRSADPPAGGGKPVLLWVDTFTDHFAPQVGQAAVRVLEDAGYAVQIPRGHVCCGLTWISPGQLDGAGRGAGAGGRGIRRAVPARPRLLRPDLDLHGTAGRGPPATAPQPGRL